MGDEVYYYTSEQVFWKWYQNEIIWATRSITSNDAQDTCAIIQYYPKIKKNFIKWNQIENEFSLEEIDRLFKYATEFIKYSKCISFRTYKDFLFLLMNRPNDYRSELFNAVNGDNFVQNLLYKKGYLTYPQEKPNSYYAKDIHFDDSQLKEIFGASQNDTAFDKEILFRVMSIRHPFCICFTERRDDRFFWETYAGNTGVCFEFSKEELKYYCSKTLPSAIAYDVNYGISKKFFDNPQNIIKQFFETQQHIRKALPSYNGFDESIDILYLLGSFIKNSYWKSEKEFRILVPEKYEFPETYQIHENYALKHRKDLKTQDYIEIRLPKSLVKSITLGPRNTFAKSKIESCSKELNVKIKYSSGKRCFNY